MIESNEHFFDYSRVFEKVQEFFPQHVLVVPDQRVQWASRSCGSQRIGIIHTVHEIHIVSRGERRDTREEWIVEDLLETAATTQTCAGVESSQATFSFGLRVKVHRVDIYRTSRKAFEFLQWAWKVWMPSGESALAFIALEQYHVIQWLEGISDSFQNTSSELRPVLGSSHGHITVSKERKFFRETVVTLRTHLGPQNVSFLPCVSNFLVRNLVADVLQSFKPNDHTFNRHCWSGSESAFSWF